MFGEDRVEAILFPGTERALWKKQHMNKTFLEAILASMISYGPLKQKCCAVPSKMLAQMRAFGAQSALETRYCCKN